MSLNYKYPQPQIFRIYPWTKVPFWELWDSALSTKSPRRTLTHSPCCVINIETMLRILLLFAMVREPPEDIVTDNCPQKRVFLKVQVSSEILSHYYRKICIFWTHWKERNSLTLLASPFLQGSTLSDRQGLSHWFLSVWALDFPSCRDTERRPFRVLSHEL